MKIRIGIEGARPLLLERIRSLGAPILVSANSLWDDERQKFGAWKPFCQFDVALDSGGFVAMKRYGRYRWRVADYVLLARDMHPTWWAQMDFCCEPEIAADRAAVSQRIHLTVAHLHECQRVARGENVPMPLPVLQGWHPEDYCRGPIYDERFEWPMLVGIGSVCRRHLHGRAGLLAVMDALDAHVPRSVQFHLFGVKSQAIAAVAKHFPGRVASIDSMAWNMQARWIGHHQNIPTDARMRTEVMTAWYQRQLAHLQ